MSLSIEAKNVFLIFFIQGTHMNFTKIALCALMAFTASTQINAMPYQNCADLEVTYSEVTKKLLAAMISGDEAKIKVHTESKNALTQAISKCHITNPQKSHCPGLMAIIHRQASDVSHLTNGWNLAIEAADSEHIINFKEHNALKAKRDLDTFMLAHKDLLEKCTK